MKIRVYPANGNDNNSIYEELEFDALPRVGDFVGVPFDVEQAWARKALQRKSLCEYFSQWLYRKCIDKEELDFGDARIVSEICWLYDYNLNKMVCWMSLDSDIREEYQVSQDGLYDLSEEEFEIIKKKTSKLYELEEI
jgi:hypothetical protein